MDISEDEGGDDSEPQAGEYLPNILEAEETVWKLKKSSSKEVVGD